MYNFFFLTGRLQIYQQNCTLENDINVCTCLENQPKQKIDIVANSSAIYLIHSCLDLDVTISASNYTGRVQLGVLAANKMTVTQKGYLAGIELFSDASVNQLKNFTSESLRIVSPSNKVVISNSSWQEKASINIGYANKFSLTDTSVSCARKKAIQRQNASKDFYATGAE